MGGGIPGAGSCSYVVTVTSCPTSSVPVAKLLLYSVPSIIQYSMICNKLLRVHYMYSVGALQPLANMLNCVMLYKQYFFNANQIMIQKF